MKPVEIHSCGMVTSVGLSSPASCAAIRAGISRVQELPFLLGEEPLFGAPVPLEAPIGSRERLLQLAIMAVGECLREGAPAAADLTWREQLPLLLCLPEPQRAGRVEGLDERFLFQLRHHLDLGPSPTAPALIARGRAGGVEALSIASELLAAGASACVVAGVDTLLTAETLTAYHEQDRLKSEANSNGLIPGEAAAAVLLRPPTAGRGALQCIGLGLSSEPAPIGSGEPLRAEGLFRAVREAIRASGAPEGELAYRVTDLNGESFGFKEASLAVTRALRAPRERFPLWHPSDCIGDVGAAIVPVVLGVVRAAVEKGYAPGPSALCHFSSDGVERGALVLRSTATR